MKERKKMKMHNVSPPSWYLCSTSEETFCFLTMPKCWCNQNKPIIHWCYNRANSAVRLRENITLCRKESLSRTSVTEFVFQYMNHNPLKQGSHYVNRVLHSGSLLLNLQHKVTDDHRHERSIWMYLNCWYVQRFDELCPPLGVHLHIHHSSRYIILLML